MAIRYNFDTATVPGRVIMQRTRVADAAPPVWEYWLSLKTSATVQFDPIVEVNNISATAGRIIIKDDGSSIELPINKKEQLFMNGTANTSAVPVFAQTLMTTVFNLVPGGGASGGATESTQVLIKDAAINIDGYTQNIRTSLGDINDTTNAGNYTGAATTNQILRSIGIEQKVANGGTATPKHIVAAASINAQILKLGPGRTVGTGYFNVVAAGTKQIRVYDTNVSPTNPALFLNRLIYSGVATTIGQVLEIPPLNFTLGLAITMTAGTTPTDNTAVAVNSCRLTLSHT